jgi:hypothetical protein
MSMSLVDYASSDDEGAGSSTSAGIPQFTSATRVVAAPDVSLEVESTLLVVFHILDFS